MPEPEFTPPPSRHAERLTEKRNPRTMTIDRVAIPEALAMLRAEDQLCLDACEAAAPEIARAVEAVERAFRAGGRLIYLGAGTSGRLGVLDASEQPPTFGAPPGMVVGIIAGGDTALRNAVEGAEDRGEEGVQAVEDAAAGPNDVIMGITSGGRAPYVLAALDRARVRGAFTILLTCTPPLAGEERLADLQIHALVGPEPITGSTRMKSGTVTKLILNQITTLAMVRIGKVYENLMVDLRPTNAKLVDRAARILMELAGLERAHAEARLRESGMELKVAIVMSLTGLAAEDARRELASRGGHIAETIRALKP